jgi:DNA-binding transcriptional MerR regulator
MTELPVSTLRYWEEQFEQLKPLKNDKGKRFYTTQDIELVKQIKFIRDDLQITRIDAIRTELASGAKNTEARQRATELLKKIRQQLVDIRSEI